jgi:hypothetical protein
MDDFRIIVCLITICVSAFWILIMAACLKPMKDEGYKKAYEDMHQNKIEATAQTKFPDLWIKYNVTKGKERGPE